MTAPDRLLHDLRERVKELTALHETARLLQNANQDPQDPEGPFLREERHLLESLAEMLGSYFSRRESEEKLRKANEDLELRVTERTRQLRDLAAELSLAEDRQRRAIATDLHDHVGQTLAMVKMLLQELQGEQIFGSLYGRLGHITKLVNQTIGYTRTLTVELSPPILHELGLEAALEWLGAQMKQKYGYKVTVKREKQPIALTDDLKGALFRFVSELLTNAGKHAHATYLIITIQQLAGELEITVGDNGLGFDPGRLEPTVSGSRGFGLFSIKERLGYFGGLLRIESRPGAGTRIVMRIPL